MADRVRELGLEARVTVRGAAAYDDVVIGMPVAVRFARRGEQTLPVFGAV